MESIINNIISVYQKNQDLLEYKFNNELANVKRQLEERDYKLESQAKRLKEREEKIKELEPLVVRQLSEEVLIVYYLGPDVTGNFCYRGFQIQKGNIYPHYEGKLIFIANVSNTINEWSKLKSSSAEFNEFNVLKSRFNMAEFLAILKYSIPDGNALDFQTRQQDSNFLENWMSSVEGNIHDIIEKQTPSPLYLKIENYIHACTIQGNGFIKLQQLYRDSGIKCKSKEFCAIAKDIFVARGGKFMKNYSPTIDGKQVKFYNVVGGMVLQN